MGILRVLYLRRLQIDGGDLRFPNVTTVRGWSGGCVPKGREEREAEREAGVQRSYDPTRLPGGIDRACDYPASNR